MTQTLKKIREPEKVVREQYLVEYAFANEVTLLATRSRK